MKTVLLLAYQYPPALSSAAKRSGCMAKYLPHYGWRPVVISRLWTPENGRYDPNLVRDLPPEALVAAIPDGNRRAYSGAFARIRMFVHPSTNPHRWTQSVLKVLPRIVNQYKPDAIWATCLPHATLYIADYISRKMGIPWIADFRDVLGQFGSDERLHRRLLINPRVVPLESRLIRSASTVTTVSEGLARILQGRHQREVDIIPNGFDPDDYAQTTWDKHDRFSIRYFGSLYTSRDPSTLFAAIDSLERNRLIKLEDIRLQFYGSNPAYLASFVRDYCCRQVVKCHPVIPHREAIHLQQNSSVLLVLSGAGGKGILTGKVFEYLASQRPILCAPGDGDCIDRLLRETNAGVSCSTINEVATQLLKWYREWKAIGTIRYEGRLDAIMKYSREEQAGQLADLLNILTRGSAENDSGKNNI